MLGVCHYNPSQHLLLEPQLLDWCKKQVSDQSIKDELFVYRQMYVGTFVIGRWVSKSSGLFVDLLNLGGSLGNFTREVAQEFRKRLLAPITTDQARKHITTFDSRYRSEQNDINTANHELLKRNSMIPV